MIFSHQQVSAAPQWNVVNPSTKITQREPLQRLVIDLQLACVHHTADFKDRPILKPSPSRIKPPYGQYDFAWKVWKGIIAKSQLSSTTLGEIRRGFGNATDLLWWYRSPVFKGKLGKINFRAFIFDDGQEHSNRAECAKILGMKSSNVWKHKCLWYEEEETTCISLQRNIPEYHQSVNVRVCRDLHFPVVSKLWCKSMINWSSCDYHGMCKLLPFWLSRLHMICSKFCNLRKEPCSIMWRYLIIQLWTPLAHMTNLRNNSISWCIGHLLKTWWPKIYLRREIFTGAEKFLK